jgi:hypothetical protein
MGFLSGDRFKSLIVEEGQTLIKGLHALAQTLPAINIRPFDVLQRLHHPPYSILLRR